MKKFLKIGCLGFVSLFVLMIVFGFIAALVSDEPTNKSDTELITTSSDTEEQDIESTDQPKSIEIGEEFKIGDVVFKVNSIEEVGQISAANGYMKYTPDADGAVFLNVNVTVKNEGKDMINTDSSFFKIKTDDGVEYSPSTILVADERYFVYEGINPGLALTGNVVFEVPGGLTGLDLQVQTGFLGTETGLINLN